MKKIRISKIEHAKGYKGTGVCKVADIRLFAYLGAKDGITFETFRSYKKDSNPLFKKRRLRYATKCVSVYEHEQEYGGSEEGGWYYFTSRLLSSKKALCCKYGDGSWIVADKGARVALNKNTGLHGRYQYEGYTSWIIEDIKGQHQNLSRQYYQ
jgi:hypothetical protein